MYAELCRLSRLAACHPRGVYMPGAAVVFGGVCGFQAAAAPSRVVCRSFWQVGGAEGRIVSEKARERLQI